MLLLLCQYLWVLVEVICLTELLKAGPELVSVLWLSLWSALMSSECSITFRLAHLIKQAVAT